MSAILFENFEQMDYVQECYRKQIDQLNEHTAKRELELEKMHEELRKAQLDCCHQLVVDYANLPIDIGVVNDEQQEQQIK